MTLRAGALPGLMNQPTAQIIDGSLRFNGTNHHLSRSFSAGNRRTWTWSAWVKRYKYGATNYGLFSYYPGSGNGGFIRFSDDSGGDTLRVYSDTNTRSIVSKEVFRDTGWYHIVIAVDTTQGTDTDRVKRYVNGVQQTTNASNTWPSASEELLFNQSGNHFLGRVQASAYGPVAMSQCYFIDGQALGPGYFGFTDPLTGTWRPKKLRQGDPTVNDGTVWSDSLTGARTDGTNEADDAFDGSLTTKAGTSGTGASAQLTFTSPKPIHYSSGVRVYVYWGSANDVTMRLDGGAPITVPGNTWTYLDQGTGSFKTLTINGTSNSAELSAIEVDGVIMQDSTTTTVDFGTNGFYLPMDNQDDFEKDKSGKGNDWTKNNFSGTFIDPDVRKDSPSGAVSGGRAQTGITTTSSAPANYATLNPLQQSLNRTPTLSDGNLTVSLSSGGSEWTNTGCTMNIGSGKYYWEVQFTAIDGTLARIGVADSDDYEFNRDTSGTGLPWLGSGTGTSWSLDVGGNTYYNGSTVNSSYTSTIITSDIIGVLLDLDNNTLSYSKNGTNLGVAHSNVTSDFVTPGFGLHGATTNTINVNFGQKPFKYAPPQGYLPLNSATVRPNKVIPRPDKFVGIATYTGSTGQSITMGFKPDLLWIKSRTNSGAPAWMDSVRGSNKQLNTNNQNAESTNSASAGVLSFDFNGFTLGTESSATGSTNGSQSYVAWGWKAGGGKSGGGGFFKDDVEYASAAAAGLTGGDKTLSAASVNTKTGFSILKWTNGNTTSPASARVPHGLTQSPDFVIYKDPDSTTANWAVKSEAFSNPVRTEFYLDSTDQAPTAGVDLWFRDSDYIGHRETSIGGNGNPMMAYCWHDVPGLQKFGKYFGNSDADGPFIELGFRPALLIVRRIEDDGNEMVIFDSERTKINQGSNNSAYLRSPDAGSEGTANNVDFLSNGFKWRKSDAYTNDDDSSTGFIYAAWAEVPASNLYGGQSNAR